MSFKRTFRCFLQKSPKSKLPFSPLCSALLRSASSSMADNEAHQTTGEGFSQLLFAETNVGLDTDGCYNYTTAFSAENPPKMLCFGDTQCSVFRSDDKKPTIQKSQIACTDSTKSTGKRNGSADVTTGVGARARNKRPKSETGNGKVKKEKLGERVMALQQLVSPYGKTDTASVLHEAMGYIKFLQEQVQVLCSPYLQAVNENNGDGVKVKSDLKSMGLCLVPVESISLVANNNGADFWSPAMAKRFAQK